MLPAALALVCIVCTCPDGQSHLAAASPHPKPETGGTSYWHGPCAHTEGQPHLAAACEGARCTRTQGSGQVPQKPQSISYVPLDVTRAALDLTFSSDELLMSRSPLCPCGTLQTVEWPT